MNYFEYFESGKMKEGIPHDDKIMERGMLDIAKGLRAILENPDDNDLEYSIIKKKLSMVEIYWLYKALTNRYGK